MELGIAVIGVLSVAGCAAPFVITNKIRKSRENKLLQSLRELGKQRNCEIADHEICGSYAIGIGEGKTGKFLLFQLRADEKVQENVIDLAAVSECKLIRKNFSNQTIKQLALELIFGDKSKATAVLEFYNDEWHHQISGEWESIQKWQKLIRQRL